MRNILYSLFMLALMHICNGLGYVVMTLQSRFRIIYSFGFLSVQKKMKVKKEGAILALWSFFNIWTDY